MGQGEGGSGFDHVTDRLSPTCGLPPGHTDAAARLYERRHSSSPKQHGGIV